MEPVSFAASLATIGGIVVASSKKIHDLYGRYKNSSKDMDYLMAELQTFEGLINEVKLQCQNHQNSTSLQKTLQQLWGTSISQMQRDALSLQAILAKLEPQRPKKLKNSKMMLLARKYLNEEDIQQYQKKIHAHYAILINIQAMIHT